MKIPVLFQPKIDKKVKQAINIAKEYHNKSDDKNMLYCPYCGAPLMLTDRKEKLETLDEHVTCSAVSEKSVYKCLANCNESTYTKWNYNGDSYLDIPYEISKEEFDKRYEVNKRFYNRCPEAINSYAFAQNISDMLYDKHGEICLFTYPWNKHKKLYLKKRYYTDNFGKVEYYKIRTYLRVYYDNNCYMPHKTWLSWLDTFRLQIKTAHQRYFKNFDEESLKILYGYNTNNIIYCREKKWNFIENIWYSKLVPLIYGKIYGVEYLVDKNKGQ